MKLLARVALCAVSLFATSCYVYLPGAEQTGEPTVTTSAGAEPAAPDVRARPRSCSNEGAGGVIENASAFPVVVTVSVQWLGPDNLVLEEVVFDTDPAPAGGEVAWSIDVPTAIDHPRRCQVEVVEARTAE